MPGARMAPPPASSLARERGPGLRIAAPRTACSRAAPECWRRGVRESACSEIGTKSDTDARSTGARPVFEIVWAAAAASR